MTQKTKKILLGSILGISLSSVAIATPFVLTSCNNADNIAINGIKLFNGICEYTRQIPKILWSKSNNTTLHDLKEGIDNALAAANIDGSSLTVKEIKTLEIVKDRGDVTFTLNQSINNLTDDNKCKSIEISLPDIKISGLPFSPINKPDQNKPTIDTINLFNTINGVSLSVSKDEWNKAGPELVTTINKALSNSDIKINVESIVNMQNETNTSTITLKVDNLAKFEPPKDDARVSFDVSKNEIILKNLNLNNPNNKQFNAQKLYDSLSASTNVIPSDVWIKKPLSQSIKDVVNQAMTSAVVNNQPISVDLNSLVTSYNEQTKTGEISIPTTIAASDILIANPIVDNIKIDNKTIIISNLPLSPKTAITINSTSLYQTISEASNKISPKDWEAKTQVVQDAIDNGISAVSNNAITTVTLINTTFDQKANNGSVTFTIDKEVELDNKQNQNVIINGNEITVSNLPLSPKTAITINSTSLYQTISEASNKISPKDWEAKTEAVQNAINNGISAASNKATTTATLINTTFDQQTNNATVTFSIDKEVELNDNQNQNVTINGKEITVSNLKLNLQSDPITIINTTLLHETISQASREISPKDWEAKTEAVQNAINNGISAATKGAIKTTTLKKTKIDNGKGSVTFTINGNVKLDNESSNNVSITKQDITVSNLNIAPYEIDANSLYTKLTETSKTYTSTDWKNKKSGSFFKSFDTIITNAINSIVTNGKIKLANITPDFITNSNQIKTGTITLTIVGQFSLTNTNPNVSTEGQTITINNLPLKDGEPITPELITFKGEDLYNNIKKESLNISINEWKTNKEIVSNLVNKVLNSVTNGAITTANVIEHNVINENSRTVKFSVDKPINLSDEASFKNVIVEPDNKTITISNLPLASKTTITIDTTSLYKTISQASSEISSKDWIAKTEAVQDAINNGISAASTKAITTATLINTTFDQQTNNGTVTFSIDKEVELNDNQNQNVTINGKEITVSNLKLNLQSDPTTTINTTLLHETISQASNKISPKDWEAKTEAVQNAINNGISAATKGAIKTARLNTTDIVKGKGKITFTINDNVNFDNKTDANVSIDNNQNITVSNLNIAPYKIDANLLYTKLSEKSKTYNPLSWVLISFINKNIKSEINSAIINGQIKNVKILTTIGDSLDGTKTGSMILDIEGQINLINTNPNILIDGQRITVNNLELKDSNSSPSENTYHL